MSLGSIRLGVRDKFSDPIYKAAFLESRLAEEVAHSLKLIREASNLRQAELAERSGTKQGAISRIENSEAPNWNIRTLLKISCALNHRIKIVFQPMEEALQEFSNPPSEKKNSLRESMREAVLPTEVYQSKPASAKAVSLIDLWSDHDLCSGDYWSKHRQNKTVKSAFDLIGQR